ncbi:hypothetical protein D6817_02425, partial [Candidatus Pacearchaeota archaeon]
IVACEKRTGVNFFFYSARARALTSGSSPWFVVKKFSVKWRMRKTRKRARARFVLEKIGKARIILRER